MTALSSRYTYEGTETTETSITRVGSPVDPTGQAQSRKIVTTANSQWLRPFKAEPYVAWNGVTDTNVTATVYGVVNYDALPLNDELWMDVEHLKASSGVLGTIVTTTKSNLLASGAAVSSDSSVWSGFVTTYDNTTVSNVSLSNGYLTATHTTTSAAGATGTVFYGTGKYYFEVTVTQLSVNGGYIGIKIFSAAYTGVANGTVYYSASGVGNILVDGTSQSGKALGYSVGSVISVAADLTNRLIWIRRNGGNWNNDGTANPATGVGGISIATLGDYAPASVFASSGTIGDNFTINFGVSTYVYTKPSGFSDWNVQRPFKLTKVLDFNPTAPIAAVSATWDATTVTAVTLSGGDLVATNTGTTSADQGVRVASALGKTTGKYYFEFTWTAPGGNNQGIGVGTTASTYTNMGNSATTGTVNYRTGSIYSNGSLAVSWTAWGVGAVTGVAIDLDNRMAWFHTASGGDWNNSGTANPATNVGGVTIPAGTMVPFNTFGGAAGTAGRVCTTNFGATAFVGTVPSGFTSGWPGTPAVPAYNAPVGYIEARVRAAKASTTYYIDPTIQLSPSTPTAGATTPYTTSRYTYEGTETTETSITRVNGAADPLGNRQSRKIVTTANSQWLRPFRAEPYAAWNNTTGSNVTVTVCGTVNSGTLPLNDEIWMDVEYLTLSSQPNPTQFDVVVSTTVSNGGLTVTHGNSTNSVGANSSVFLASGKYYFEFTITETSFPGNAVGIILSTGTYADVGSGLKCTAVAMSGAVSSNEVLTGVALGSISSGDVVSVAIDLTARLAWFRNNNGNWNNSGTANPATGVGGVVVGPGAFAPCVRFTSATPTNNFTGNFGATAFTYTAPSGFGNWLSAPAPLGKIVTTTKANVLASGTSVTSDSSTWNNAVTSAFATFDPATVTAVTLSGGNLVATNTGTTSADQGVRVASALALINGKYYFEVTYTTIVGTPGNLGVGIGTPASTYIAMGANATTGALVFRSGAIYANGSNTSVVLGSNFTSGTVAGVAVDLDARQIWFRQGASGNWNGNASYNPATNVGGIALPLGTMVPYCTFGGSGGASGSVYTANFGASAFTGTVPSGFYSGWKSSWTPFKLTTTLSSPQPGVAGYIHVRPRVAKASATYYIDPLVTMS